MGTLRGPRVVQRRQAIAIATDDIDDQGPAPSPTSRDERMDSTTSVTPWLSARRVATSWTMARRAVIESRRLRLAISAICPPPELQPRPVRVTP